jgi:hypothetical protein
MKIFYDTEFLEDGHTIDLISIGLVAEDGRQLYAINEFAPLHEILAHDWLMANVVPSLPLRITHRDSAGVPNGIWWDDQHPDRQHVHTKGAIADQVRDFILTTPDVELWAWYGAYDHVALCQLWGRMIDLPSGVPMWTNDLRQECMRLGNPRVPEQAEGEHNALADAKHNQVMSRFLAAYKKSRFVIENHHEPGSPEDLAMRTRLGDHEG